MKHVFVLGHDPGELPGFVVEPIDRSGHLLSLKRAPERAPIDWRALAWTADGPVDVAPPPGTIAHYGLIEQPAWYAADPLPDDWVKQVSFVARRTELTATEFRRHHREHIEVARVHHPGIATYVQDDIESIDGGPSADALSELTFASEADLAERFYASGDSRDVVRADTSEYIDFGRTFSVMTHGRAWHPPA